MKEFYYSSSIFLLLLNIFRFAHQSLQSGCVHNANLSDYLQLDYIYSGSAFLFQPLVIEFKLPVNDNLPEKFNHNCFAAEIELRYRSLDGIFVPKPLMSNGLELDYDVEDGSRTLTTFKVEINLREEGKKSNRLELDCAHFVRPGFYGVGLKAGATKVWNISI
jgi:hypothetical protein